MQNYRDLLKIDKHELDRCLIEQADVYYRVSEEYAKAVSRRDEAYENLKQVDAELSIDLRAEMEAEGKKVTEASLSANVLAHALHKKAHETLLNCKESVEILAAQKEAFIQRSYMLRELCQLYAVGYFTKDSIKGDKTPAERQVSYEGRRRRMAESRGRRRLSSDDDA